MKGLALWLPSCQRDGEQENEATKGHEDNKVKLISKKKHYFHFTFPLIRTNISLPIYHAWGCPSCCWNWKNMM